MSEMVERVKRALQTAVSMFPIGDYHAYLLARAAIEAMREPTDAMCEAAEWHQQSDVNKYQAAIDAAISPGVAKKPEIGPTDGGFQVRVTEPRTGR